MSSELNRDGAESPLKLQPAKSSTGSLSPLFLRELASRYGISAFVETGTYLGNTTAVAAEVFDDVFTIELSADLAERARRRFAEQPRVRVIEGDSGESLRDILPQISGVTLFWLDGHFSEGVTARGKSNTPILEELSIIAASGRKDAVILVDDLRLFERSVDQVEAGSSLYGYPTVNQLHRAILDIDPEYQFFVFGDVALAVPPAIPCAVSPVVQALTISRLFDGQNLPIEDVIAAEGVIGSAEGIERDAIRLLPGIASACENRGFGLHYRLWSGLTYVAEKRLEEAALEYSQTAELGFRHWRVYWYQSVALHLLGQNDAARVILSELAQSVPDFRPAQVLLAELPPEVPAPAPGANGTTARPQLEVSEDVVARLLQLGLHREGSALRLHLGCGEQHFRGYVNVDYPPSQHTCQTRIGADVFADITRLRLRSQAVDEIRLHHVFEHFKRSEALGLLIIWHEALKIGGRLHIETPDVLGCAQQLVADIPFRMKQAVIRHCFGSQEAGWAIHYDGWTEEKYRHVLGRLGFKVETKAWRWPHPPHLANVEAIATKVVDLSREQLLAVADELLSEYIVADVASERGMCDVWRRAMREFLSNVPEARKPRPAVAREALVMTEKCPAPRASGKSADESRIVVKLQGGLGNQMFQYAAGLALARKTGAKLHLDVGFLLDRTPRANFTYRDFDLDLFAIDGQCEISRGLEQTSLDRLKRCVERGSGFDPDFSGWSGNVYLDGYWQSHRYFAAVLAEVRATFTAFTRPLDDAQNQLATQIRNSASVCLNVRRADYVTNPLANACHGVCNESYFRSAVRLIRQRVPEAHFYIFSDDIEWCRTANLVGDAPKTLVSHRLAGERFSSYLQLMMSCRHFIIPNSSFGWWAAFLGEKPGSCVVAPTPWFNDLATEYADLFPSSWTLLSREPGAIAEAGAEPEVSVVIQCCDDAQFLPEAIGSIVNQTFGRWEAIVVDCGGSDEAARQMARISECYPDRSIRFLRCDNVSAADAWNRGVQVATGKFFVPLIASDKLAPRVLELGLAKCRTGGRPTLVYGHSKPIGRADLTGTCLTMKVGDQGGQAALPYCVLSARELWTQLGGFRSGIGAGTEIWDFWLRCFGAGSAAVLVDAPWVYARSKSARLSRDGRARLLVEHPHCFDSVEVDAARSQGRPAVSSPGSVASPSVSVIVACHNYGQYLERAVASVLAQSYRDFEIIIVDDGSSDDSVAVARKIIERNLTGVPIRLLQLDDVGPSEARRRGVGESAGRYFLPLDADDRIAPEFLERTVPVLEANEKLGFAYVDTVYFGDQERRHHQPEYDFKRLCAGNFISYASLVRRAAFDSVDGYDRSNWGYYEDWDLWIRLGKAGWFGKHVPEPLFFYHQHFSSSLSFYSRRLDPVYRAFVIASNAALYPPSVRAKADAILAEMPTGWHRSPPLRELAKIRAKLERFPGNRHVRFFLAIALQRSGDLTGAMRVLEELARDYPADDLVRVTLREFASSASLQRDEGVAPVTSGAPLVSVVVPCFNQAQFLQEALGSVVAQSFSDWEVIIVNDGSPDDTSAVAKSIMAANPRRRIRLIEKANGGLADARNAGISFARGKYILPLDADDRVHPNAVKKMVALLEANPGVGIAYCDWQYFGADDRVRNAIDYDFKRLCSKENLFTCTSMFRKSAWEAVGGFNINMTHGVEDWDFWISCGEKGFVGRRIPEVLFYYRSKPGSMIRTLQPHLTAMFARIVMNHPALYGAAAVDAARVIFERAGLPGPKPSMPGTEWSSLEAPGPHEMGRARESAVQPAVANGFGREVPSTGPVAVERVPGSAWSESDGGGELDALIRRFAEDPSDPAVRSALLKIRRKVHAVLRHHEADPQHLERLFAGSLGRAFRSLAGSGICLAVEREDQVEAAQSLAGAAEDLYLPRLLACIIAVPAHRIAIPMHLDRLPVWCIDDVLAYLLAAPQVLVIAGEADQYLDHHTAFGAALVDRIKAAPADPLTLRVARAYVEKINCIPCYTASGNTLPLMRCRAAAIEFVLERNGAVLDATFPRPSRRKIRVGFLSAHFGEQTETHVTLPALHLDRSRFEVLLFPLHTLGSDLESRCRSLADQFVPLPQGLGAQVARLREAALDVLIIGTNVTAVTNQVALLAAHRLASVQLVSYCSPMSTGLRNVDGYLFGHLSMFSQVEEHFSEKLVVCEGAPGCLDYTYEKPGSMRFDRKSLGIGQSEIVFVNAASCYKVPLELQETWAKLLQRVPGSRLLLLPFNPNWSNRFPARLFGQTIQSVFASHGVSTDRLILANPLPSRNDVKAIERLGDIYLDTFPFSGSLSVIDPLEIGLPVVAWQGRTPRSRAAASLLRAVGLEQLIANEEPEYLGLAERLARDTEYRNTVAATVRKAMQSKPRFLDPSGYGRDLSNVLEAWVQRKRSEAQRQRSSEVASVF